MFQKVYCLLIKEVMIGFLLLYIKFQIYTPVNTIRQVALKKWIHKPERYGFDKEAEKDPYPWLDIDDPRRNQTDEQILEKSIGLSDSDLNSQEKEHLVKYDKTAQGSFQP